MKTPNETKKEALRLYKIALKEWKKLQKKNGDNTLKMRAELDYALNAEIIRASEELESSLVYNIKKLQVALNKLKTNKVEDIDYSELSQGEIEKTMYNIGILQSLIKKRVEVKRIVDKIIENGDIKCSEQ